LRIGTGGGLLWTRWWTFVFWSRKVSYNSKQGWFIFLFPLGRLAQVSEKHPSTFSTTNSQFSLPFTTVPQQWQIATLYGQIWILPKCAQVTLRLHIISNLLLQQLVSDAVFTRKTYTSW
jgi:hypothetical protein